MWKLLVSILLWLLFVYAMNRPWQAGDLALPPLGQFFSPVAGFWANAEPSDHHKSDREIVLNGVTAEVQIVLDDRLVPHIFAQNDRDAWFAQGYITAMFRLWQMDISARATAGELSAIFGKRMLEYDKSQRTLGLGFAAENAVDGWTKFPNGVTAVDAYASGYNAYLSALSPSKYPIEYKLINYAPEPWSPLKSALFAKSMATRLCMAEDDLEHTKLQQLLGDDRFDHLFMEHDPLESPVIPAGTPWNFSVEPTTIQTRDSADVHVPGARGSQTSEEMIEGSNNWAVSGIRTESGKPILCNDPHLGLSLPSVWFEIHIVTPNFNVYGVSLPGLPGVIIGFNEHIAWGITNTGYDVLDWYHIEWTDSLHHAYMLDGKEMPVTYRVEEIEVKGGDTVIDTVTYTQWGPVQKSGPHQGLAMRWLAHDVPDNHEAEVFLRLNKATSYDAFTAALSGFQTPGQNFVYADNAGNIALQIAGKMPMRQDRNGRFVQDGSKSHNGWSGRIPFAHNPVVVNPPRGFVSSANQETTDSTYPYIYLGAFEDFRGRILNRYLASMSGARLSDMTALQNDAVSLKAEELLPLLIEAIPPSKGEHEAILTMMRDWKYDYRTDLEAPVFFELWYDAFNKMVWDDFVGARDSLYINLPQAWRTNLLAMTEPASREFDIDSTSTVELFKDIAVASFNRTLNAYNTIETSARNWGDFRKTTVRHMANIPAFSHEISANGHGDALNATTTSHGPSWRMIVHLADPVEAMVIYPGGQSGNPGSMHYADMIETWRQGKYYKVNLAKFPDEYVGASVVRLKPTDK